MRRPKSASARMLASHGVPNRPPATSGVALGNQTAFQEARSATFGARRIARRVVAMGACAVAVVAVAACGSGPSSGSSSGSPAGVPSGTTGGANVSAAQAAIAPFTGKPSPFPVTEPLSKRLPGGTKFAFLQCATPNCALAGKYYQEAVSAIGGTFTAVNAGTTAAASQAAASSVLALKPDVVFVTVDPSLYGDALKKMSDAGIKVISISVVKDVAPFGVTFNYIGAPEIEEDGRLLADWVIANKGPEANAVFYSLPAFDFSNLLQRAFETEMAKNCPSCQVRAVPIDVATIGTTAPRTIVTDLQAKPATNVAVFLSLQMAQGLPAAMRAAGLSVTTVGRGPTPVSLQDIKDGGLTAGLALDLEVGGWIGVDAGARLLLGDQPTANEKAGVLIKQFLGQKDIVFDPTNGWSGYPDFKNRFAALWHTGG